VWGLIVFQLLIWSGRTSWRLYTAYDQQYFLYEIWYIQLHTCCAQVVWDARVLIYWVGGGAESKATSNNLQHPTVVRLNLLSMFSNPTFLPCELLISASKPTFHLTWANFSNYRMVAWEISHPHQPPCSSQSSNSALRRLVNNISLSVLKKKSILFGVFTLCNGFCPFASTNNKVK